MPRKPAASSTAEGEDVLTLREPRYSQSLERGLLILTCFTPDQPVLGIADIADQLGMTRSTTHRYVITLLALGYLEQGANRKYRLGLKVTDLGMSAINSTGMREHATPILEALRHRTSYTASLAALDGTSVVYLDRWASFHGRWDGAPSQLAIGSRVPFHHSALGRVIVAHLPESQREGAVENIDGISKKRKKGLLDELDHVAELGYATILDEIEGFAVVAVPVLGEGGAVVAAISLETERHGFSVGSERELLNQLRAAADELSARLGYRRERASEPIAA